MSIDTEVLQLSARVVELESKVGFLLRHFNVTYVKPVEEYNQRVMDVLRQSGNMIEAIRLYREIYSVDLATSKKAVEEMKAGLI